MRGPNDSWVPVWLESVPEEHRPAAQRFIEAVFWIERRVDYQLPPPPHGYQRAVAILWEAVVFRPAQIRLQLRRCLWRLKFYLGEPLNEPEPPPEQGSYTAAKLRQCPTLDQATASMTDLDWVKLFQAWGCYSGLFSPEECEETPTVEMALEEELARFNDEIGQALQDWVGFAVPVLEECQVLMHEINQRLDPMSSYFFNVDPRNGQPAFVFRRGNEPRQPTDIIPDEETASLAMQPDSIAAARPNVFDVLCVGFQLLFSALGVHTYPRGWYPADAADTTNPPDWQISNLGDHLAQIHQELRDLSGVRAEVRTGTNPEDIQEQTFSLPEAVGALVGAVSEMALDAQRAHILSAQAARTALTVSAQLGTKLQPGTVDLGWRGQVNTPFSDAASIAQALAAIEAQLNRIALALGVAPAPPQQGGGGGGG